MKSLNAAFTSASRVKRFCNNKWSHVIKRSIFLPISGTAAKCLLGRELIAAQEEIMYSWIYLPRHICSNVFSKKYKSQNGTCHISINNVPCRHCLISRTGPLNSGSRIKQTNGPFIKHIDFEDADKRRAEWSVVMKRRCSPLLACTAISSLQNPWLVCVHLSGWTIPRAEHLCRDLHLQRFFSTSPKIEFLLQCSNTVTVPARAPEASMDPNYTAEGS